MTATATAVRERPILFSGEMVRGILDDRKGQTRRTRGLDIVNAAPGEWEYVGSTCVSLFRNTLSGHLVGLRCPFGARGDRLWVREQHTIRPVESEPGEWESLARPVIGYKADGGSQRVEGNRSTGVGIFHGTVGVGRPSIHMKRWMSRLTLELVSVRVQRVQEISEADAVAEGVVCPQCDGQNWREVGGESEQCAHSLCGDGRGLFHALWDSLNAKRGYSWDANPWCWALTFRRAA
jgi:hypothetical protein